MNQLATVPEPQLPVQPPMYAMHDEAVSEQAPSLRDFLAILKRRKMIAIQAFIVVVALGVVLTFMAKPIYRSAARVLVEGKSQVMSINNTSNPLSNLFLPSAGFETQTQVEILRSSDVARKAAKESKVEPGKAFLDVRRVADTDVIELSTTSTSPSAAYEYLKAVPAVYLRDLRTDRMREVSAALDFAQKRLKEENQRLKASELALQKFRQNARLIDPEAERTGALAESTAARAALGEAQANVDSLRAQLEAFTATRRQLPAEIASPTTTTNTAELQDLRKQIAELKSQRQSSLFLYKPTDDEIRKIDRQIADLQARLQNTPRDVTTTSRAPNPAIIEYDSKIADVRANLRAAEANVKILSARSATLAKGLNRYNPIERQQAQLQRDIASSTGTVTSLTQSSEELALRKKALESSNDPITVIEAASQPVKISPNVPRNIILSIALGLLLACGAAMLQESLDDHMRDEDEVRRMLGVPILGHFPIMPEKHKSLPEILREAQASALKKVASSTANGTAAHSSTLALSDNGLPFDALITELDKDDNPLGSDPLAGGYRQGHERNLLEKFRVLRSNVQFTLLDRTHSTILITSSVPQEGKSYTASNLAAAMALDGKRVILVDADLHRPRQHETFNVAVQPGLTNILVGQAKLSDCLHDTGINNLRLLTAGILPPNPVELLNSPAMEALLEALKAETDVVIFDSPPLLATSDAQVLASKVDGVLYVMQLGRVAKSSVARSFELLAQARADVLGIALNKIDARTTHSNDYGGYYYSGYYGREADDNNRRNGSAPKEADVSSANKTADV